MWSRRWRQEALLQTGDRGYSGRGCPNDHRIGDTGRRSGGPACKWRGARVDEDEDRGGARGLSTPRLKETGGGRRSPRGYRGGGSAHGRGKWNQSVDIMIGCRERVAVEPRAPQTLYLVSCSRASTPSRIFRPVDGDQGCVWSAPPLPARSSTTVIAAHLELDGKPAERCGCGVSGLG